MASEGIAEIVFKELLLCIIKFLSLLVGEGLDVMYS